MSFSRVTNVARIIEVGRRHRARAAREIRPHRMSYCGPMNFDAVRRTVEDVIEALWATDPLEKLIVRQGWPGASCENVAVAVAAVLEDRGLGQWAYVQANRPGELNGHAWLEWRDTDGTVRFSIDRTLHQFEEWSEPFVGEGMTPAAAVFTVRSWEGVIWELPWIETSMRKLIPAVREQLGDR